MISTPCLFPSDLDLAQIGADKAACPALTHQRNSPSMPRFSPRAGLVLLATCIITFAPMGLRSAAAQTPAQSAPAPATGLTVSVVRPQSQPLVETLLVTGSLLPREEIQVGPEVEGLRLEEILVDEGDTVKKGQTIAKVGNSGGSAEPQLHFEVRRSGKTIDPTTVLGAQ